MKTIRIIILHTFRFAVPLVAFMALVLVLEGDHALVRLVARIMDPLDVQPYLAEEASPVMLDRDGDILYSFLTRNEQWRFPVSLDKINPLLEQATLAAEDKRFYQHAGVDARAVMRAAWLNLKARRYVSGASTLTMQLVKQRTPTPRTLVGKMQQALLAIRLDYAASKSYVLEAYLNKAPYGGNLVGVEAAARRYFGKSSAELTLAEAATLAGLPKAPTVFDPLRRPEMALRRRDHVLRRMLREDMIATGEYERALSQPLGVRWHEYPTYAPHIAMAFRDSIQERNELRLTLDGVLQARLETFVPHYLKQFDNQITNAALLVVDTQNGTVLARVGSADFNNDVIQGQVDLCRAPRAPGSALKPFVYALALETNRLYPTEGLLDNTLDYGVYNPVNFDGTFSGMVSATEALRWSLNVPAIQVQSRVGVAETMTFMKQLGFDTLHRTAEAYGLGLVLGNCEVRLESLVEAYLALARLGEHAPLRLHNRQPEASKKRVLSEGVALALWNMLEQPFPEETLSNLVRPGDRTTRVAWKTGTSTGYHDAWAVAFNRHYVVGAWLGNNDGRPSNRLIGAHAALPLVSRVFRSLPVMSTPDWPHRRHTLRETAVCAVTGLPKSQWCPAALTAWLPQNQYLHRRCDVHRPGNNGVVDTHWPGAPYTWDLARVPRRTAPAWAAEHYTTTKKEANPESVAPQRHKHLDIVAPANNATYILTGDDRGDRIQLSASNNSTSLHWYHNDRYLGRSAHNVPLYLGLTPGEHRVACMGEDGQTAAVVFTVLAG